MPSSEPNLPDALFRLATDQSSIGVLWVAQDASIRYSNAKMAQLLGFSDGELMGKDVQVFDPSWDRKRWAEVWKLLQRDRPFTFERNVIAQSGRSFPVEVSTSYFELDGEGLYVAYVTDISSRKRIAATRRQAEDQYRLLVDEASDGIFVADPTGRYTDVNRRGCEMLGYAKEEILNLTVFDLVESHDQPDLDSLKASKSVVRERNLRRKDGTLLPVEISAKQLPNGALLGIVRDVSERRAAEAALRQTLFQTEQVLESVPCGVLRVSAEGIILFSNSVAAKFFGIPSQEVVGKSVTSFGYKMVSDDGDRYTPGEKILRHVIETRQPFPPRIHGVELPTGEIAWFLITAVPFYAEIGSSPEAVMVFLDVTKQREGEIALREFQLKLKLSVETLPVAFWTVDADLRITSALGSDLKAFGIESNKTVGELFAESAEAEEVVSAHLEALAGKSESLDIHWASRYFSLRIRPLRNAAQEIIGAVALAVDISERKTIEHEMLQLNDTLERRVAARTAELAATVKELESFAYSVSHDLRSPLRAISGYAFMIREDFAEKLGQEPIDLLNRIEANAKRMSGLIDDLLRFSRLGRAPLDLKQLNMKAMAAEVFEELPGSSRVKLNALPMPSIQGDRGLMRQVWANLLTNAIKFSRNSEIPTIEVGGSLEDDGARFYVKDNGIGFDEAYKARLFVVFSRLHSDKDYEGTGIGLATVQRIIAKHGGKVWASGEPGQGATFFFSIPTSDF